MRKEVQLCLKWNISNTKYKWKKVSHDLFQSLIIQWYLSKLELAKNWHGDKLLKLEKSKFWELQLFLSRSYLIKYLVFLYLLTDSLSSGSTCIVLYENRKKWFSQTLRFRSGTAISINYILRLLEITGYQNIMVFFKLIKRVLFSQLTLIQLLRPFPIQGKHLLWQIFSDRKFLLWMLKSFSI